MIEDQAIYGAIVVLGRGIGRDPKGRWRPTPYFTENPQAGIFTNKPNLDNSEVGGGNANTLAAVHFYERLCLEGVPPNLIIFAAGRPNYLSQENPSLSEGKVMRERFLRGVRLRRLKFPETEILVKNKNTRDDMERSLAVLAEIGIKDAAIISIEPHLERAQEFMQIAYKKAGLEIDQFRLDFIPAERILGQASTRFRRRFEGVQDKTPYIRTQAKENQGVRDIKSQTYDFKT